MSFSDEATFDLPLLGGVVQAQRLVVPHQVIQSIKSYRHACRLAWKLRRPRNLTQASLAGQAGLYQPHVSEYFSIREKKRELPAKHIAAVERVFRNTVISQYQAHCAALTVLEELQAERRSA